MKKQELVEQFEQFKKQYEELSPKLSFDEFNKYFYVDGYFLSRTFPYLEKFFYENMLQIITNNLKHILSDLEYYVNISPQTPLTRSDLEIVKDNKELLEHYYKLHKLFKKSNLFYAKHKEGSTQVLEILFESYDAIKAFSEFHATLIEELMENLDKKFNEIHKEAKPKFDSSIYH